MLTRVEARDLASNVPEAAKEFLRPLYGSKEYISNTPRFCIWITDDELAGAMDVAAIAERVREVAVARSGKSKDRQAQKLVAAPHRFRDQYGAEEVFLLFPL